jgi:DNA polymerase-1
MQQDLEDNQTVSCDLETTHLYPWKGDIVAIGFGTRTKQWIIPWNHKENPCRATLEVSARLLNRIVKGNGLKLVGQNFKFDSLWLRVKHGLEWDAYFDTMLAHYLLNENSPHDLEFLSQSYFGAPEYDVDLEIKQGKRGIAALSRYLALDLYYTRKLRFTLERQMTATLRKVFYHLLMPCSRLFTEVEFNGLFIDKSRFDEVEDSLGEDVNEITKKLEAYAPGINFKSTLQLRKFLFETLKIPVVDQTATGEASTSKSVLKRIAHPVAAELLKLRAANQQLSFFIDGWRPYMDGSYLHGTYKLHGTVTGRPSSANPNLQQIDRRLKSLISAPRGWVLIEADLSQIEMRIAADLAQEEKMLEAFREGGDIHVKTAQEVLGKKDITKEDRQKAKAVGFGFLYGMWWRKFQIYARDQYGVEVSEEEAKRVRKGFFKAYPGLVDWHRRQQDFVRLNGYVVSLFGRRRRLPDAMGGYDTAERAEAWRQAINAPVQSAASDINLICALELKRAFPDRNDLQICATVHDSILFRVREPLAETASKKILDIMRRPPMLLLFGINLVVPLDAEVKRLK